MHKPQRAKNYKARRRKMLSMKIENLVEGIMVIIFGAILFADAFQVTYNPASQLLSPNDVKGITGFVFIVIAIFYFIKAREKK
jgi:putative Ca2+/H+ antiporter (TMEM165/GDT1 family)